MKVYTINEAGTAKIIEFVREKGTQEVKEALHRGGLGSWQSDAEDAADRGDYQIEAGPFLTASGRPEILQFEKSDFDVEMMPEEAKVTYTVTICRTADTTGELIAESRHGRNGCYYWRRCVAVWDGKELTNTEFDDVFVVEKKVATLESLFRRGHDSRHKIVFWGPMSTAEENEALAKFFEIIASRPAAG